MEQPNQSFAFPVISVKLSRVTILQYAMLAITALWVHHLRFSARIPSTARAKVLSNAYVNSDKKLKRIRTGLL